jgi:hypothetical protein
MPGGATLRFICNKVTPVIVSFSNSTQKIELDSNVPDNFSDTFFKILYSYADYFNYIDI